MAESRGPALTASVLLHGGLFALAFLALPKDRLPDLTPPSTPVTVVASAPAAEADVRPAVQAPEPAPAASEEPEAEPLPPAPIERPAPPASPPPPPKAATPPPKPAPTPKPAAPPLRPAPAAKVAPRPDLDLGKLAAAPVAKAKPQALDLGALASTAPTRSSAARSSLDLDALSGGSRHAAGARGPARPETAREARPAVGAAAGLSGDVRGALAAKLIRLWNLECSVEGANTVVARVHIHIAPDGSLVEPPTLIGTTGEASAAVRQAAGLRAVSAVSRGAPYVEVPPEQRKTLNDFNFTFDAKQACR